MRKVLAFLLLLSSAAFAADQPWITAVTVGTAWNGFWATVAGGNKFTVGGANLTVTKLGRYCLTGNSQTHTVYISLNDATVIASAAVNMSGCTPGTFVYAAASATLTAGSTYYVISSESNTGDTWYNDDTVITTTADATANCSVVSFISPPGSFSEDICGSFRRAFGPANFTFSSGASVVIMPRSILGIL